MKPIIKPMYTAKDENGCEYLYDKKPEVCGWFGEWLRHECGSSTLYIRKTARIKSWEKSLKKVIVTIQEDTK